MADITCFNTEKVGRLKTSLEKMSVSGQSEAFKAAGHERRLEVLMLLGIEGECCVCDIANTFECPVPTVSQYLRILKNASLINCRVDGKFMHYSLTDLGKQIVALSG